MDKKDFKRVLAGISVASLLTGVGIGCTTQQPSAPETEKVPAQTQEAPAPGKEAPAPSS